MRLRLVGVLILVIVAVAALWLFLKPASEAPSPPQSSPPDAPVSTPSAVPRAEPAPQPSDQPEQASESPQPEETTFFPEIEFLDSPPPDGAGAIAGRAFDAGTGAGVAKVRMSACPQEGGVVRWSNPSDANGMYRVEGLATGTYEVWPEEAPGYPPSGWADRRNVQVTDGETTTGVDFALKHGPVLSGTARDPRGNPVDGARVLCAHRYAEPQIAMTSGDGAFEIQVSAGTTAYLSASKDRMCSTVLGPLAPGPEGLSDIVLTLDMGASISGKAVTQSRRPMAGVFAVAEPVGDEGWEYRHQRYAKTDSAGAFHLEDLVPATYGLHVFERKSSDEEFFMAGEFGDLAEPENREALIERIQSEFMAQAREDMGASFNEEMAEDIMEQFAEATEETLSDRSPGTPFGDAENELDRVALAAGQHLTGVKLVCSEATTNGWALPPGDYAGISGRILDPEGNPVEEANVHAYALVAGEMVNRNVSSDDEGAFHIDGLAEGVYSLCARHMGFAEYEMGGIPAGSRDLEIVLSAFGVISGRVMDAASSAPVTVFQVGFRRGLRSGDDPWCTQWEVPGSQGMFYCSGPPYVFVEICDDNGCFTLSNVEPGAATIYVVAEGYAVGCVEVPDVSPGKAVAGLAVKLTASSGLRGQVVTAAGEVVAAASVGIGGSPDPDLAEGIAVTRTAADGTFALGTVFVGSQSVWASHPDFATARAVVTHQTDDVTLVLSRGGVIEGMLTLDGVPVPECWVSVRSSDPQEGSQGIPSAQTDAEGCYRLENVPHGTYALHVFHRSSDGGTFYSAAGEAVVAEGMMTELDLELVEGQPLVAQ